MAAAGTSATDGNTSAGDGIVATTVGTKDPDHVNKSEGVPAANIAGEEKEEGGPCGLPFKCVIL